MTRANLNLVKGNFTGGRYGQGRKAQQGYRNATLPYLVKGYGGQRVLRGTDVGGNAWYERVEQSDPTTLSRYGDFAGETLDAVIAKGLYRPKKAMKGFYPDLASTISGLNAFSPQNLSMQMTGAAWGKQIGAAMGKSFSLASPLASGFVPFDLVPFVRTIYPVYTPLRNKIARVPGQGEYHKGKILASISGSLPGNLGSLQNDATSEFFGGSGFSAWPNPLPNSGSQTAYDISIPYKFYALTEAVSWLAQFSGQGFDDMYGLASLVLLQEFMLLEEHDMLASTSQALTSPTFTVTARAAGTGETAITGITNGQNIYVKVSAINYWGETVPGAGVSAVWATGNVVDVFITVPSKATLGYRIYVTNGTAAGTYYLWTYNTSAQNPGTIGGSKFTLQGAVPVSGTTPPTADTGTYSTNNSESLLSIVSGQAYNSGSGPYPNVSGGYYNGTEGTTLSVSTVQAALLQMFNGNGAYFANPSEIICSPNDAYILAQSIQNETVAAYQLRIQQSEVAGVTGGVAVSNVVNPVTRSAPEIVVHPYLPQGNALLMSYTLPQTQNNLGNVVEMVMVQDYAQIGWPVIDPSFRLSQLRYGAMYLSAPQYCGLIGGLTQTSAAPWS